MRQGGFFLGGDIKPQPATVLEVLERELEFVLTGAHEVVALGNALAIVLGTVQRDIGLALNFKAQNDRVELGPPAPVGGRKGVEVGLKRGFLAGRNGHRGAVGPAEALAVLFRLNKVEHADVKGFAALGQQNSLQGLKSRGVVGSHDCFDSPNYLNSSQRFSVVVL